MAALDIGTEVTVRWTSSLNGSTMRFRAVYRGTRERDGSLELFRPDLGQFAAAPASADITVHRKRKWDSR
jgi:hypothetical protein